MLKAQKKISKRELKHDPLLESMGKVTSFYEDNKKFIQYALGALVVLVVGGYAYVQNQATRNNDASTKLATVYPLYDKDQYQLAIDGVPERKVTGLKSIVDEYGGTTSGNLARFYLANCYFNLGKYDEAVSHFEDFSASQQYLVISRLTGLAACYEAKGEYEKAAESFEKAVAKYPKDVDAAANLNNAAANFMLAGNKDRAVELFKKLKKEFPTSPFARDADRHIQRLTSS
jgi:tetratricopeptide (TPR) repeat protein